MPCSISLELLQSIPVILIPSARQADHHPCNNQIATNKPAGHRPEGHKRVRIYNSLTRFCSDALTLIKSLAITVFFELINQSLTGIAFLASEITLRAQFCEQPLTNRGSFTRIYILVGTTNCLHSPIYCSGCASPSADVLCCSTFFAELIWPSPVPISPNWRCLPPSPATRVSARPLSNSACRPPP